MRSLVLWKAGKQMAIKVNKIAEYAEKQAEICSRNDSISPRLFEEYGVFRGLRDEKGNGVLTGLTSISEIISSKIVEGKKEPCEGELWYRGYEIQSLIRSFGSSSYGFEKVTYLLLFGQIPNEKELAEFLEVIGQNRTLPVNFTRDVIMKAPTSDIMNGITKSILTLASYDENVSGGGISNNLRQCIRLISLFPVLTIYSYHAYNYAENDESMYIHKPNPELSTAENLLMMLRADRQFTQTEAKVLDTALILHMEHGGGNNSTFTTRVVTSTGSDTYSTIAAAMSSLKGPKHGGANIKVMEMMEDIRSHVSDTDNREEVKAYLEKILDKKAFDKKGLIYGMGHAIYTLSDPRERIFKQYVEKLAKEKGREKDMRFYNLIEELSPDLIAERFPGGSKISPNVDFYSGFVYEMMDIPLELYTAIFAVARIVGWSAHRIEELVTTDKIIRPAYKSVMQKRDDLPGRE